MHSQRTISGMKIKARNSEESMPVQETGKLTYCVINKVSESESTLFFKSTGNKSNHQLLLLKCIFIQMFPVL